jgi:nitroreductase
MNNVLTALNWRYAVKKFDTKKIPQEKLEVILESLRLTPSSFGMQNWKFVIVNNPEIREKLVPVS